MTRTSDATTASTGAETAIRVPLVEGIMADLAAIDPSTGQLPKIRICEHFVPIGDADEQVKRLVMLRAAVERDLECLNDQAISEALSTLGEQDADYRNVVNMLVNICDVSYVKTLLSAATLEAGEHAERRSNVIEIMLSDALSRAFPQHARKDLLVSSEGVVGYIDHSEKVIQDIKASIADGTFDFSGYPPEVLAAVQAGMFEVINMGCGSLGLKIG